jgi:hypothetical protein
VGSSSYGTGICIFWKSSGWVSNQLVEERPECGFVEEYAGMGRKMRWILEGGKDLQCEMQAITISPMVGMYLSTAYDTPGCIMYIFVKRYQRANTCVRTHLEWICFVDFVLIFPLKF